MTASEDGPHLATRTDPDLRGRWGNALAALRSQRGGPALADDLAGGRSDASWLAAAVAARAVWVLEGVAVALVDDTTIVGVYVDPAHRREGAARRLVTAVRQAHPLVRDASALPGDRATKSLYESLGWRARLLTMSAPASPDAEAAPAVGEGAP